ncbi:MAG: hypothetical protein ACJ8C4_19990 [Gemmataceae bacterium]
MPLVLQPRPQTGDLHARLDELRQRLRQIALTSGIIGFVAGISISAALACWLDLAFQLPSVVRAFLLAGLIVEVVWLARRLLINPLRAVGDEAHVALEIEHHYPHFDDALASAVEFARDHESSGSAQLRRATERRAIGQSLDIDFSGLADSRPVRVALFAIVVAAIVVGPLLFQPYVGLLLTRLADPYGAHPWPPQTQLTVVAPSQLARGESFEVQVAVEGRVPDQATMLFALEGATAVEHAYPLTPQSKNGKEQFVIKLEPSRVWRSFRYQLSANDATTGWRSVNVLVPAELAALDGRPSPQIHLDYPTYTDQAAIDLPAGTCAIEAVLGTKLTIRAAVDRPIASAAIQLRPEPRVAAGFIGPLFGANDITTALGFCPAITTVAAPMPLALDSTGTRCSGMIVPMVGGSYDLLLTDATGLTGRRPLDIRVQPDPSPAVALERPAWTTDSLEVLPTASFTLKASIDDNVFSIRRVAVEYRTDGNEKPRRLLIYDGDELGKAISSATSRLTIANPVNLRPKHLDIERQIPLAQFRHANGKPLATGDVLTISVIAEDFDDVSPWKAPGRSHEVDLRIVSSERLDAIAQKTRSDLAAGLRDLLARQADAHRRTAAAETERRATGQLRSESAAALDRAITEQQQIQEKLGDDRDGLRAQAERLARLLAEQNTEPSPARDRAERLAEGLERLDNEVLPPIGPTLAAARNEPGPTPPDQRDRGPLPDAVRQQTEAERSLRELAELAEAGNAANALAAEAANLGVEQRQLKTERDELARKLPPGTDPGSVSKNDRAALEQLRERQEALAQKAANLTQQLDAHADAARDAAKSPTTSDSASREKSERLEREAKALDSARQAAHGNATKSKEPVANQMIRAAESIAKNQLGDAQERQNQAIEQLDRIRDILRDADSPDLDRLLKDRERVEQEVDRLSKMQESLQKESRAAAQIGDEAEGKKQLQRLAKEEEKLAEQAHETARELTRQRQTDAARDMERAAKAMEQAGDEMEQGRNPDEAEDDALDHLDDAAERTQQAKNQTEEQLRREKALKFSERLGGLVDRQAALAAEGERLFQAAQAGGAWSRSLTKSLADLGRDQDGMAKEVEQATKDHLQPLKVLKRMADQATEAMSQTAAAIEDARQNGLNAATIDADRAAIRKPQELALKRLKQLQALTKAAPEEADRKSKQAAGQSGQAGDSPSRPQSGERIPATAQLQALRELQSEVNERTAAFAKDHPNSAAWTDADRAELDSIRKAQTELVELLSEVVPEPAPAGGKK